MARPIHIAAAGDIHCSPESRERVEEAFARIADVDLILLAGDLTTHGEPEQAAVLADICRSAKPRIVAVLGHHDWHANRSDHLVPTLEGEPRVIWAFLGTDRMAPPIGKHRPDVVLHGHAHRGTFEGEIGEVPVYNVAVAVMRRDFFVFELGDDGLRAV